MSGNFRASRRWNGDRSRGTGVSPARGSRIPAKRARIGFDLKTGRALRGGRILETSALGGGPAFARLANARMASLSGRRRPARRPGPAALPGSIQTAWRAAGAEKVATASSMVATMLQPRVSS